MQTEEMIATMNESITREKCVTIAKIKSKYAEDDDESLSSLMISLKMSFDKILNSFTLYWQKLLTYCVLMPNPI